MNWFYGISWFYASCCHQSPLFLSVNIFYGHSITKLLVHKKITIVWKPTTFCNGYLIWFFFSKQIYPIRIGKWNDMIGKNFHVTNYMLNKMCKYLMLCFNKINLHVPFCSVESPTYHNYVAYGTQKKRSIFDFHHIYISKTPDQNHYHFHQPAAQE